MKNIGKKFVLNVMLMAALVAGIGTTLKAQESPMEEDFFKIMRISSPEGTLLEVGGLVVLPNGDLGIATRRGDIFIAENPTSARPFFRKFASGLHEVLGLAYKDGALYCAQRGELTKLTDTDNDGKADLFETVYAWPLSGNYHEYSFGPKLAPDGSFFVSTNLGFPNPWWHAKSLAPWRGWMLHITEDGKMEPWATGMRSPAGLGMVDGELFYAENQGDWVGSGGIWHVKKGSFTVHPGGLRWTSSPESPVKLTQEQVFAKMDSRNEVDERGEPVKPENRQNEEFVTMFDMKKQFPELQLPAVWLPHGIYGISNSEIIKIPEGNFGPFEGQLLVGDQGQSKIMRVVLEKVNGEYQGVAFDFRSGFQSGVLRMDWAKDGSLFIGETNRGWGSAGEANEGLQRLVWNNKVPFEMRTVRAMPDGFEVEFTAPVDKKSAEDVASYAVESFIYKYHAVYGSPTVNQKQLPVKGVKLSDDGMKARIVVDGLREGYIHLLKLDGVRAKENYYTLVHPFGYYTLNSIPDGEKLALTEISTRNSAEEAKRRAAAAKATKKTVAKASTKAASKKVSAKTAPVKEALTFDDVKPLLAKNTCLACHNADKKQVGPAFKDVAKRKYTNSQIVELIHTPKPDNWPGYATPMPPMPQVPKDEALKIAAWINTLN
ncbi:c-type cytochrome [Pontibacter silvestris]|uniref:C-type cytochrome n=1 Tax=Pontibacter silvestris TaxID=2305183 RepID=A0ABW4WZK0_9BACT|nr:c-type cytochrome [Pontibacter silvestris]MCC9137590.1 c-type cytochrome [Pontibacter silvestris]